MTETTTDPNALRLMEALHSTPARRRLSTEPIPDEALWTILDAAINGPSGGNAQHWGWVVVRDAEVKRQIGAWYLEGWDAAYGSRREQFLQPDSGQGMTPRGFLGAEHLAHHIADAPVWVMPVLRGAAEATSPLTGSSIYGAVQQLMLAARAYGIGTNLTTLYAAHEADVRELLGLPGDARTMCLIPMGYPAAGRWAPPRRNPVHEVVHWDAWGATRER